MTRRALVTGGSGAIGAAIARNLAAAGCEVFVHANRNTEAASNVVEEIRADDGRAEVLGFDITDADATRATVILEPGETP